MIKLLLEMERDTPLCIAETLIAYEYDYSSPSPHEIDRVIAQECIRQIGQALINHVESQEKINKWLTERSG